MKCRGCGAEIAFITTVDNKRMPVNPESVYFVPAGGPNTYVLVDGTVKRGRPTQIGDKQSWIGYISHFATCPQRDSFRKDREEAKP